MNAKMIINKTENNRFKVVGYDENGLCWSYKFWNSKDEAIDNTIDLLKDYNREHYKIIDQTV